MHFQTGLEGGQIRLVGGHPREVLADENPVRKGGAIERNLGGEFAKPREGRAVVGRTREMNPRNVHPGSDQFVGEVGAGYCGS